MNHRPGCPEQAGGDCACPQFGQVWHFRWGGGVVHSAALVVGMSPRSREEVLLLALSDTNFTTPMSVPIVAKNVHGYEPCTDACPFNPDYEGASK